MIHLIVKEIKERKYVLLLGIILSLIPRLAALFEASFPQDWPFKNIIPLIAFFDLVLLLLLLPIVIAESQIAGELEKRTLSFLFSLPLSRLSLWAAKLLSSIFCQFFTVTFFLLVNWPVLFEKLKTGLGGSNVVLQVVLLIYVISLYYVSISFYCSTISSKSMTASAGALLLFLTLLVFMAGLLNTLSWSVGLIENLFIMGFQALIFLGASFAVFVKSEFFNYRKRLNTILRASLAGFTLVAASMICVYFGSYYFLTPRAIEIEQVSCEPGSGRLIVGVKNEGVYDYSMWLIDPAGRSTIKSKERNIMAPLFIGKNLVQYEKLNMVDLLLKGTVILEHWLTDLERGEKRLLYSSRVDLKSLGGFFSKGVFAHEGDTYIVLIMPRKEKKAIRLDITIVSPEGKVLKDIRLPQELDAGASIQESSETESEKAHQIDFQSIKRGERMVLIVLFTYRNKARGETEFLTLNEIDVQKRKEQVLLDIPIPQDEKYGSFKISSDGSRLMAIRKRSAYQLVVRDLTRVDSPWITVLDNQEAIRNAEWLPDGKRIVCIIEESGERDCIALIDVEKVTREKIAIAPHIHTFRLSPGGSQIAFLGSPDGTSRLNLFVRPLSPDGEPLKVTGRDFPKSPQWTYQWEDESRLIVILFPWEIYEVTLDPKGPSERKLYPFEEAR